MKKLGRPASGPKLKVLEPVKKRYPNPPPGMNPAARTVWHRVCRSFSVGFYTPQHYDLLRAYSEASALHIKAVRELREGEEVITQKNGVIKINPWIHIMEKSSSSMASLGTKLQLHKSNTLTSRGQEENQSKPASKRKGLLFTD